MIDGVSLPVIKTADRIIFHMGGNNLSMPGMNVATFSLYIFENYTRYLVEVHTCPSTAPFYVAREHYVLQQPPK